MKQNYYLSANLPSPAPSAMMARPNQLKERFAFPFPLKQKRVQDLRFITLVTGMLQVEGVATLNKDVSPLSPYERYEVEITAVLFEGVNILPVLEVTGGVEEMEAHCLRQAPGLFIETSTNMNPLYAITRIVYDVKETSPLYQEHNPIVVDLGHHAIRIHALCVSPKMDLFLKNEREEWYKLEATDENYNAVVNAVYARLETLSEGRIKEVANG